MESTETMNSGAGKVEDHSESQGGGGAVLASLWNTVDHSNSPDFFGGHV